MLASVMDEARTIIFLVKCICKLAGLKRIMAMLLQHSNSFCRSHKYHVGNNQRFKRFIYLETSHYIFVVHLSDVQDITSCSILLRLDLCSVSGIFQNIRIIMIFSKSALLEEHLILYT